MQARHTHAEFVKEFRWWFTSRRRKEFSFKAEYRIFGKKQYFDLSENDVDELCKDCGKLTSAMLVFYMKNLLYEKMKDIGVKCNLAFPEVIGSGPNMLANRFDRTTPLIVPVLISKPMEHWCLAMIVSFVEEERVFWFDSLNTEIERSCTKKIEDAINTFRVAATGEKKKVTWKQIKCQKQAESWKSGFYVIMFVRDILIRQKSITYTQECLESYLSRYPTKQRVMDDINLLKWELLEAYRVRHPEYERVLY